MALGRTDLQMKLAFRFSVLWVLAVLLTVWHGIAAVAAAYSVCVLLFAVWSLSICLPLIGCTASAYARALLWPAVIAIGSVVSYETLAAGLGLAELGKVALAAILGLLSASLSLIAQRSELRTALKPSTPLEAASAM